jgi:hypothetical protein
MEKTPNSCPFMPRGKNTSNSRPWDSQHWFGAISSPFHRKNYFRGNGNIMEGMSMFKLHSTHVWNYHKEILSYC